MKRTLALILSVLMILSVCTLTWAEEDITVEVDGVQLDFDVPPAIVNGRTMLPLRVIFEALGLNVGWDPVTKTITGTGDGTTVILTIDNPNAAVNGKSITLDVPAMIMNGRTVVPTRFVAEATGADVGWNGAMRRVTIGAGPANKQKPNNMTETISIGLVTDVAGIEDGSFNQLTWEGITRFAEEYNLTQDDYTYLESESDDVYGSNLDMMIAAEKDLIVAPGFLLADTVATKAAENPNQKFLVLDASAEGEQVISASFAEEQGSFLAGVAAALKAQAAGHDTVGFVGGMDIPIIHRFEAGYEAGVHAVDPNMTILIEYAESFSDQDRGRALAEEMYGKGAYVLYQAAGSTGNGVIEVTKEMVSAGDDFWVIGVDIDQYDKGVYDGENSVILTSMVKKLDEVTYMVAKSVMDETFMGGAIHYTLADGAVGLPDTNPNLTEDMTNTINDYATQIINGTIVVPTSPTRLE